MHIYNQYNFSHDGNCATLSLLSLFYKKCESYAIRGHHACVVALLHGKFSANYGFYATQYGGHHMV
jgi:hypothetical protein